jgi:hypothetical protein
MFTVNRRLACKWPVEGQSCGNQVGLTVHLFSCGLRRGHAGGRPENLATSGFAGNGHAGDAEIGKLELTRFLVGRGF